MSDSVALLIMRHGRKITRKDVKSSGAQSLGTTLFSTAEDALYAVQLAEHVLRVATQDKPATIGIDSNVQEYLRIGPSFRTSHTEMT